MAKPETNPSTQAAGAAFATTLWSVVWHAQQNNSPSCDEALNRLCRAYWAPLYAFIRREGYRREEAQDLTQEFLSRFVQKQWLSRLQDQRFKFRTFLLTFLKTFLSDQRDRANAQKRGGGASLIPIDAYEAEEREGFCPVDGLTADQIYDQRWARALADEAVRRLREEYIARGKGALYEQLKDLRPREHGPESYADIGAALGMTEQAIKNAVHYFRRRYGELLQDEILQTVENAADAEAEFQHVLQIFAG
jgi:DNA-directed RNA polymerase specialized sigma24 family protein